MNFPRHLNTGVITKCRRDVWPVDRTPDHGPSGNGSGLADDQWRGDVGIVWTEFDAAAMLAESKALVTCKDDKRVGKLARLLKSSQ